MADKKVLEKLASGVDQGNLRYPYDLGADGNICSMAFTIFTPQGSKFNKSGGKKVENLPSSLEAARKHKTSSLAARMLLNKQPRQTDKRIYLYMPDTITTSLGHDWQFDEIGTIGRMDEASENFGSNWKAFFKQMGNSAVHFGAQVGDTITPINFAAFTELKTQTLINPFRELLFKGTENRSFSFTYTFSPKNKKETETVKEIIHQFQFHSCPEFKDGILSNILYPSMFDIEFLYGPEKNKYIGQIGTCVLTSIETNYTDAGQWSAFHDGSPTHMSITLNFTEIEWMTKERLKDLNK